MSEAKNDALAKLLSSERHASAHVPPCFIWHTLGDQSIDIGHSLDFAQDLNDQGVPFELHTFERGRHGLGLNTDNPWPENCIAWLKVRQFICASKGFALASALPGAR